MKPWSGGVSFLWVQGSCACQGELTGSAQEGAEFHHLTLHCDLESVGSNALPRMVKPWGLGLGNTLNCCSVTVKGEDTGQVSREEASDTLFGQLHFEPTGPGKS